MSMLQANSPVALYEQLYDKLRTAIEEGHLATGKQLPSERQLAADFGISRVTTRRALDKLQREGYIAAFQGKGSFVAAGAPQATTPDVLQGFAEAMLERGMVPRSRILSQGIVPVTDAVARRLGCERNDRVIRIRRLRLADNTPIALHTSYLRYPLCRPILEIDLEKFSLYRVLQENLNIRLARTDRRARSIMGSTRDLALLDLSPPATLMQVFRQTYDDHGYVVEYLEAIQREDAGLLTARLDSI
jgi:GntR family transcriptional regulator